MNSVEVSHVSKSFDGQAVVISMSLVIELSSRVFWAGLLMYGKKPTIKEVIKYVRAN